MILLAASIFQSSALGTKITELILELPELWLRRRCIPVFPAVADLIPEFPLPPDEEPDPAVTLTNKSSNSCWAPHISWA